MNHYVEFVEKIFLPTKPLAKLFISDGEGYIYDTGTNQILKCTDDVFLLLSNLYSFPPRDALEITLRQIPKEKLIEALKVVEAVYNNGKILSLKSSDVSFILSHFDDYEKYVSVKLGQIILEVTQKCNLRCKYCIYNSRIKDLRCHGDLDMSEVTAYQAIDFLYEHSTENESPAISFYGGEPLLNFQLIKKVVDYSKQKYKGIKFRYAITTNGTLITEEIAEFLANNYFNCMISLDGPKHIHDQYRKTIGEKGSFNKTIEGINRLHEEYKKRNIVKSIGLSMVYMPPYSSTKLNEIHKFINQSPLLKDLSAFIITYAHYDSIPEEIIALHTTTEDMSLFNWAREKYTEFYKGNIERTPFIERLVQNQLLGVFMRQVTNECKKEIPLNGCCYPFARKINVLANGELQLCERMLGSPNLGNVANGLDFEKVKKYFIKDYSRESIKTCSNCWGNKLCSICYAHSFHSGNIELERKNGYCYSFLRELLENIKLNTQLLKINPSGLNYLAEIEVL